MGRKESNQTNKHKFSVYLRTMDHLILKLWILNGHNASFKIEILKIQDFGNLELLPMLLQ